MSIFCTYSVTVYTRAICKTWEHNFVRLTERTQCTSKYIPPMKSSRITVINSWRLEKPGKSSSPETISKNIRAKLDDTRSTCGTIKVREVDEEPRGRVAVRPEIRHTELATLYGRQM